MHEYTVLYLIRNLRKIDIEKDEEIINEIIAYEGGNRVNDQRVIARLLEILVDNNLPVFHVVTVIESRYKSSDLGHLLVKIGKIFTAEIFIENGAIVPQKKARSMGRFYETSCKMLSVKHLRYINATTGKFWNHAMFGEYLCQNGPRRNICVKTESTYEIAVFL